MSRQRLREAWRLFVCAVLGVGVVVAVSWGLPVAPSAHQASLLVALAWVVVAGCRVDRERALWHAWTRNAPVQETTVALQLAREDGVYLGRGFRWQGQDTQALEDTLLREGALPIAPDAQGGAPALHAVGLAREEPVRVPQTELSGHVGLIGTTGSGKTRCLELLSVEALRGAGAVVVIDPKGDRDWLARVATVAASTGRPFHVFTPVFPQRSVRLNVLGSATLPAEVSARVRALMPNAPRTAAQIFTEFPLTLVESVAQAQQRLGQRWTLEGLYGPCMTTGPQAALVLDYLRLLGYHESSAKVQHPLGEAVKWYRSGGVPPDLLADQLLTHYEAPRDYLLKVSGGLIPAFRGVIGDPLGPLLSDAQGLTWEQLVAEDGVLYVALGSLLLGDIAHRIGRAVLQDLIGYLGRRYAYTDVTQATPLTVLIDELGDVVYPQFTNAINKGRGANARFVVAMQSLADTEAELGREQSRRILDNLNTRIWCRLADDVTATEVTEGVGTCQILAPDNTVGIAYGGVGGLSGSASRRFSLREAPLLRAAWLTALPRGHAFVRMRGEVWKLRVPLLEPIPQTTVEALGLTALWQGLDPTMNPEPTKEIS